MLTFKGGYTNEIKKNLKDKILLELHNEGSLRHLGIQTTYKRVHYIFTGRN